MDAKELLEVLPLERAQVLLAKGEEPVAFARRHAPRHRHDGIGKER